MAPPSTRSTRPAPSASWTPPGRPGREEMAQIRLRAPDGPPAPRHTAPPRRLITDLGHDHVRFVPVCATKIRDKWRASVQYLRQPHDHVRFGGFARIIRADEGAGGGRRSGGGRCAAGGPARPGWRAAGAPWPARRWWRRWTRVRPGPARWPTTWTAG